MTPYAPTTDDPGFWTLLGPDFAGKSTVLDRLHDDHGWRVVSYDDRYLEQYPLIARLRQRWIDDAFLWTGERYSPELVLSVLHTIVLHLRDQLARSTGPEPVIVDSYFYKLLAKCRLLGLEHDPTFDLWRLFPRPRGCSTWTSRPRSSGRAAVREPFSTPLSSAPEPRAGPASFSCSPNCARRC